MRHLDKWYMQQWHITRLFSLDCYVKKKINHLEISFGMADLLVHRIHLLRNLNWACPLKKRSYTDISQNNSFSNSSGWWF